MTPAILIEQVSKSYHLGVISSGTFANDLKIWWARARGKPNPLLRLGQTDYGNHAGEEIWALRDINFTVEQGDVLGIIGRNGAGKSTLLKILSRVTAPTSGCIKVKGRIASLLEVGTGFHPDLTGRENVYLNGAILGMTKEEVNKKLDEIVAFSEIEQFLDTPVKRYSSGMYVRLAFAVAAHLDPEILLVDEVLAVGDAVFQKKCLGKIGDIANGGRTVLFVSHNLASVQNLCSRAIILQQGQLIYSGRTKDAIDNYLLSGKDSTESNSLATNPNRKGGDILRFEDISFVNPVTLEPLNILISGQLVSILIKFNYSGKAPLNNVNIGIGFLSSTGTFLFGCRTDVIGKPLSIVPGRSSAICTIPKWPTTSGRYIFNLIADVKGEVLDWIKEAGYVIVEDGDFYSTGKLPATAYQGVLISFDWDLLSNSTVHAKENSFNHVQENSDQN
jgi:lipopolysaccharide transport system ATP-binding protein